MKVAFESSVVMVPVGFPVVVSGQVKTTSVMVTSQAPGDVPLKTVAVNGTTVPQITFESAGGKERSACRLFTLQPGGLWSARAVPASVTSTQRR